MNSSMKTPSCDRPGLIARRLLLIGLMAFLFVGIYSQWPTETDAETSLAPLVFSWEDIVPSDQLEWSACYSAHQCSRLTVPLNYSEPHGEKAVIPLIRWPSIFPSNSSLYRGPVLVNPGGPGAGGVEFLSRFGLALFKIVGPEFDIVSFDPRGVARSTPRISLFATPVERALWGSRAKRELNGSSDALARHWARAQINGRLAEEQMGKYLAHINTDNTARDMLRIVEAHGREKLQYWGFSYGSVLGATFAAMFPDKVERLVIDGVVDAENYFDTLWSNNLIDADKTMQTFFDECAAAGEEACPFYAPTSEAISQKLDALFDTVRARPIPVRTDSGYGLVDYEWLRMVVFSCLYSPYTLFAPLSRALAALSTGDGSVIFKLFGEPTFECSCDPSEPGPGVVYDAQLVILCNDGKPVPSAFEESQRHYEAMVNTSSWASLYASFWVACSGWPAVPQTHFQGPVTGNTSFPMLVIGNTADPVTPLWAAQKMSRAFPGSVLLQQDCAGHSSFAAASPCTWNHVRAYFHDGILPDPGTVCPVIDSPFPDPRIRVQAHDKEQAVLAGAERNVFEAFKMAQSLNWFGREFYPIIT
ncbi:TAP-like protein-domain-containing protein [Mycena rebaudengoi]|nr:TAP-like protein-domain-containing protein [Mycena rebaudengoi]